MKFSLIFPSRGRIPFVVNLLNSVEENTFDLSSVDVHIGIDDDDIAMAESIDSFRSLFRYMNLNFHKFKRSERINTYHNSMARFSKAEYLFLMCDDVEIQTKHWDKIVEDKLSEIQPYKIGAVEDGNGMLDMFSCFPIVHRKMLDVCGYIFDEDCWVWGADVRIGMLYNKIGKYIKIPEVKVFHNSYHTNSRPLDSIGKRIQDINSAHPNGPDHEWINKTMELMGVSETG